MNIFIKNMTFYTCLLNKKAYCIKEKNMYNNLCFIFETVCLVIVIFFEEEK